MDRITDADWCGAYNCGAYSLCRKRECPAHMAWERLRQYEDSRLTPEVCKSIRRALDAGGGTATITADRNVANTITAFVRIIRGDQGVTIATIAPQEDANAAHNI